MSDFVIITGNREHKITKKYNRRLTYSELKEESQISISTLCRRFETTKINDIWNHIERNIITSKEPSSSV